jgi:hypothetical protein
MGVVRVDTPIHGVHRVKFQKDQIIQDEKCVFPALSEDGIQNLMTSSTYCEALYDSLPDNPSYGFFDCTYHDSTANLAQ